MAEITIRIKTETLDYEKRNETLREMSLARTVTVNFAISMLPSIKIFPYARQS